MIKKDVLKTMKSYYKPYHERLSINFINTMVCTIFYSNGDALTIVKDILTALEKATPENYSFRYQFILKLQ